MASERLSNIPGHQPWMHSLLWSKMHTDFSYSVQLSYASQHLFYTYVCTYVCCATSSHFYMLLCLHQCSTSSAHPQHLLDSVSSLELELQFVVSCTRMLGTELLSSQRATTVPFLSIHLASTLNNCTFSTRQWFLLKKAVGTEAALCFPVPIIANDIFYRVKYME